MELTEAFEAQRPRLVSLASRVLGDRSGAEDVVQQAWLRLDRTDAAIESLPAWLTTVTTRLCLDRLKSRTPVPVEDLGTFEGHGSGSTAAEGDPAEHVALAATVGAALQVVLDRLTPSERVAFVLHDSFGFEFATIATILDTTPAAARKLASRARAKVTPPAPEDERADWEVVDAFMAAAREGRFEQLLALLAPEAVVRADEAAIALGTPASIDGAEQVVTFFNGSAHAALPVYVGERPGSAWYHRAEAQVLFDFTIRGGRVERITFRADPSVLARVVRRWANERS